MKMKVTDCIRLKIKILEQKLMSFIINRVVNYPATRCKGFQPILEQNTSSKKLSKLVCPSPTGFHLVAGRL
jgi:hypothetical protein